MQHSGSHCNKLKALYPIALVLGLLISAPLKAVEYTQQMQLTANGEKLSLLLRPSRVTANLAVVDNNGSIQGVPVRTYIGKIEGDNNSWVRLTQGSDSLDGIISRYGKRFRLQQKGNQPARINPLADNHDLRVTLTNNPFGRTTASVTRPAQTVTRVAKIAIAVDSKFNAIHNGKGLEYALSLINSVDGIYREEFGLALQVESAINVTESAADPFNYGNIAIETMLRSFRDYRMRSTLIDNDVSLVHLFTGNEPADEPVGLAWIDTACRTDGYDVGISTHYKYDILLAAHEIAHNLGALHDSETACAASTDKVMWPYISSGTSQQFSSCTVETVKRALAHSCHAEAIDLELAVSFESGNTVKATVKNNDPFRANPAATLAIDLPEGGSTTTVQGDCIDNKINQNTKDESTIECKVGSLGPGDDSVIIFQVDPSLTNEVHASVKPDHYIDLVKDNNTLRIYTGNNNLEIETDQEPMLDSHSLLANDLTSRTNPGRLDTARSGTGSFSFAGLIFILTLLFAAKGYQCRRT